MSYFIQPIVTNKAVNEVSQAVANKETITFTRVALGSGRHRTGVETKTDIVQLVHTLPATQSMSTDTADTIRVLARLDNENITQELSINEIGVFAKRGNNPEFLFMYTWAEQGDVIPPRSQSAVYRDYDFNTTISKNQQITIQYNPNANVYARVSELNAVKNDVDNHKRDTNVHIQTGERDKWNGKAEAKHKHKVSDIDGLSDTIDEVIKDKASQSDLSTHLKDKDNPHGVTKTQVGLGNVLDVKQATKTEFDAHTQNKSNPHGVTKTQVGLGNVLDVEQASKVDLNNHTRNTNNPHNVTKTQIGLSNVDNVKQASYTDHEATKQEVIEQEQRLSLLEKMVLQNSFYVPIKAEDNTDVLLADENNNLVVADWKYQIL